MAGLVKVVFMSTSKLTPFEAAKIAADRKAAKQKTVARSSQPVEHASDVLVSLRSTQAVKLRCLFETLTPLLVEGTMCFDDAGLSIKGANVLSFAEVSIRRGKNSEISDYIFNSKSKIIVGVSFEIVHSCLSAIGPHDSCRFEITRTGLECSRPYMSLYVYNHDLKYEYRSNVYLLLIEHTEIESPLKRFSKVVSLPSSLFLKVLRFSMKRGEHLQVYTRTRETEEGKKEQFICFRTLGDEAELLFTQKFSGVGTTEILKKELYSLKYLLLISKATNLSATVELYLQKDDILAVKYRIGTIGSAVFALAPQVEEADDCPQMTDAKEATPEPSTPQPVASGFKRPVKRKKRATAKPVAKKGKAEAKQHG